MKTKKCSKCKKIKSVDDFNKDKQKKDGLNSSCRSCVSKYARSPEMRKRHLKYCHRPDVHKKSLKYAREYRERPGVKKKRREYHKNPEFKKKRKLYRIQKNYNITAKEYKQMLLLQDNKCKICGSYMEKPHVDHCHKTNEIRGVLCPSCNMGLGMFKDDPIILTQAIKYLNKD